MRLYAGDFISMIQLVLYTCNAPIIFLYGYIIQSPFRDDIIYIGFPFSWVVRLSISVFRLYCEPLTSPNGGCDVSFTVVSVRYVPPRRPGSDRQP